MTAKILPFVRTVSGNEYAEQQDPFIDKQLDKYFNEDAIVKFLENEKRKLQNFLKDK